MNISTKRVNAAVKIQLSLYKMVIRQALLEADRNRLINDMTIAEKQEYLKRIQ